MRIPASAVSAKRGPHHSGANQKLIDSWKQYNNGGTYPGNLQVANGSVPKGSAAAKHIDSVFKKNKGPDFWLGVYKHPTNGSFLITDDNSNTRVYDSKGHLVG
jgi:hypothetical protein